ncbi:hypothetical protein FALBO_3361 [Fusarium albosuccineum]|uniref:Zn(2)-C6 fungal-type domain-containing protein n=1 Tax=Fusarium albosuccineum TaxID=1237068 RepID=A0A8H4PEP0_9HYPO|nr:hypothetical protein FALBO_3361 [Fusarium albosuccineum]
MASRHDFLVKCPPGYRTNNSGSESTTMPQKALCELRGGDPYGNPQGVSVDPSSVPPKQKSQRVSKACCRCRQLKKSCNGLNPCKRCQDEAWKCEFRDPIPNPGDKDHVAILDGLTIVQATLAAFKEQANLFEKRLIKMESVFIDPYYHEPHPDRPSSKPIPPPMLVEDEVETEPGPPVPPGDSAIPINHTALAGLLLEWPSISELTERHVAKAGIRYVREYPISQEQNRGALIVHGRGEDSHPSRYVRTPTDHGGLDNASSGMGPPSTTADWDQLGRRDPLHGVEDGGGVSIFDGNPDFSESQVRRYVESFKENILNMHPIIQPQLLDNLVRHFLDALPVSRPWSVKSQTPKPAVEARGGSQTPVTTGSKRKRGPDPDGSDPFRPAPPCVGWLDRSIHSALILTILALGKICLHRENIPDALEPMERLPRGRQAIRSGAISSSLNQDRSFRSRRSSFQGVDAFCSSYSPKRNYEVIPGLEYFAYATDILGSYAGAYTSMKDVYANIFAGLFHGQLGRPMESFAFIHEASNKLQVIMRPKMDKMSRIKRNNELIQDVGYNQLALTFWTCLKLERRSDLITEMRFPPSWLLSFEDDIPHPNMSLLEGFDQRVLDSYPGQLYLRKHLNSILRMFYAPEDQTKAGEDMFRDVDVVSDAVSNMSWVAPSFAFREDDPPAGDILAARLRAQYWVAQVITYRPFIRQILQLSQSRKNHASNLSVPRTSSEFRQNAAIYPEAETHGNINPKVEEYAKKGIEALVESTRAFHGLGDDRPILANVFGTAHAQWGNLLVLSAAFKDPVLSEYVDEELLRTLFRKTIQFLQQSATTTSSLRTDMHILEGLQSDLFPPSDQRTNPRFPSGTGVPDYYTLRPVVMAAPPRVTQ